MQSLQKEMVRSFHVHSYFDRVQLNVEYLGSDPAALSSCVRLGKVDNSSFVIFGSDGTHLGCSTFDLAYGH